MSKSLLHATYVRIHAASFPWCGSVPCQAAGVTRCCLHEGNKVTMMYVKTVKVATQPMERVARFLHLPAVLTQPIPFSLMAGPTHAISTKIITKQCTYVFGDVAETGGAKTQGSRANVLAARARAANWRRGTEQLISWECLPQQKVI